MNLCLPSVCVVLVGEYSTGFDSQWHQSLWVCCSQNCDNMHGTNQVTRLRVRKRPSALVAGDHYLAIHRQEADRYPWPVHCACTYEFSSSRWFFKGPRLSHNYSLP